MDIENAIRFVGVFFKHVVGVLLLCWRRMLRAAVVAFGVGVVLTELIAVITTGQAIPGVTAQIVALLLGVALAYAVALTVLLEEFTLGVIDLIRIVEGDLSAGAHIAEAVAEREVGEVGQGFLRLLGLPVRKKGVTPPPPTQATRSVPAELPPLPRVRTSGPIPSTTRPAATPRATQPARYPAQRQGAAMSRAAMAAAAEAAAAYAASRMARSAEPEPGARTEQAEPTREPTREPTPQTPLGDPVPADKLPRIEWTYEHEAVKPPAATQEAPTEAAPPAVDEGMPDTLAELAEESASGASMATPTPEPPAAPVVAADVTPEQHMAATNVWQASPPEDSAATAGGAYEDEPLMAPAAFEVPEGPAEPAERESEVASAADQPAAPAAPEIAPEIAPAIVASAPVTTPLEAAPEGPDEPAVTGPARESAEPMMQESSAVDEPAAEPVMREQAPADTASLEAEAGGAGFGVAAPTTIPLEMEAAAPVTNDSAPPTTEAGAGVALDEAAPISERPASARQSRPIGNVSASLGDARQGSVTSPRPSAPESGLWERLSHALTSRTGTPSGPFAPPPAPRPSSASGNDMEPESDEEQG